MTSYSVDDVVDTVFELWPALSNPSITLCQGAIDITWFTQVAEEDALKAVVQRVIHITSFNAIAHWTALCDEDGRVLPGMTRQRLQWRRGGPVEIAPDAGAEYAPDSYAQPNAGGQNRVLLVRVLFQMNADLDASGMITDEHTADSTINYVKRGILTAVCSLARRQAVGRELLLLSGARHSLFPFPPAMSPLSILAAAHDLTLVEDSRKRTTATYHSDEEALQARVEIETGVASDHTRTNSDSVLFVISGPGGRCMDWHRELVVPLCAEILVAANLKFEPSRLTSPEGCKRILHTSVELHRMVHDYLRAAHRLPIESSIIVIIHVSITRPHVLETLTPAEELGYIEDFLRLNANYLSKKLKRQLNSQLALALRPHLLAEIDAVAGKLEELVNFCGTTAQRARWRADLHMSGLSLGSAAAVRMLAGKLDAQKACLHFWPQNPVPE